MDETNVLQNCINQQNENHPTSSLLDNQNHDKMDKEINILKDKENNSTTSKNDNNKQSKNDSSSNINNSSKASHSHRYRSHSRSRSRSRHHKHHSTHQPSRSRSRSKERRKNTLFDVIKNVEATVNLQKKGTIPDFDSIEPRYPYGKDLYVGNLPEGAYPEDVVAFLNKAMRTANLNIWPGDPIRSCRILPKFCFISLRHEDEATAALNMDGIYFHGQRLKLNRPVDYSGPVTTHSTWQEICPDRTWNEMFDVIGMDYKWIVRELEEFPKDVIALCVGSDEETLSPYLEITNLVTLNDVEGNLDQSDLLQDIREELQLYGNVKTLLIPSLNTEYEGKVYVEYEHQDEAKKAFNALWSRMFDNRLLGIAFFSKQQWNEMISKINKK